MSPKKYILIGIAVLILSATFLFVGYTTEKENYENEIQRLYDSKLLVLEQQLRESERQRTVLAHRLDSLDLLYKDVIRLDKQQEDSLKRVPGKFQSLTSKQLQQKMVEEYAKSKQN